MSYAQEHASAYADILAAGAAVSITSTTTSLSETSGRSTPSIAVMAGAAMETDEERKWLQDLGLVQTAALILFFVAATFGDIPALGAEINWGGKALKIRGVKPFAPDGTAIFSYLAVER
jgi:hypothetical protein